MNIITLALCAAGPAPLPDGSRKSGIAKVPLSGTVTIGPRGIDGDVQVNRTYHGYPPMALHQFPEENYAWLARHFGALDRLVGPGSMGENIAATGITEHDVHIGDRFRLGSALIEITQPRQPCATIEAHLKTKGVVKALVAAARTGWFYRVLEPGTAQAGDALERIETGDPRWSVARAFLATYGAAPGPAAELRELAGLPRVSDRLVLDIEKRLSA